MKKLLLIYALIPNLLFAQVKVDADLIRSSDHTKNWTPPAATDTIVGRATTDTLLNKTLTSPIINGGTMNSPAITTPTGIVKGDVGLGNVDNTSDATKNSATATLTNKTLTAPVINSPTGIVKGDVGLGNVANVDTTTTANITDSSNKRFVTDANLTTIGNQTGVNTGDLTSKSDTDVSAVTTNELQAPYSQITTTATGKRRLETGSKNMLKNPEFEANAAGVAPSDWTCTTGTCVTTTTAGEFTSGKGAVKITPSANALNFFQDIATTSGIQKQGYVKIAYKVPTTCSTSFVLRTRVDGSTQTEVATSKLLLDGLYHEIEVPVVFGSTSVGVQAFANGTCTGDIFLDAADISQGLGTQNISNDSDWVAYTPTLPNGMGLNTTGYTAPNGMWRRVGDSMHIRANFRNGSGGAATGTGSSYAGINIPSGYLIDTTKLPSALAGHRLDGVGSVNNTTNKVFASGTSLTVWKEGGSDYYTIADFTASTSMTVDVIVPIVGWTATNTVYAQTNTDSAWQACSFSTLAWQGMGTITDNSLYCKKAGSVLKMRGYFRVGTVASAQARMPLPNNWGSITASYQNSYIHGTVYKNANTSTNFLNVLTGGAGTAYVTFTSSMITGTNNPVTPVNGDVAFSSTNEVYINDELTIPITGWYDSNTIVGSLAEVKFASVPTTKTSAYTVTVNDDLVLVDATSAAFTVSLPQASTVKGKKYTFRKVDTSTNLVTVDPFGSEVIDVDSTVTLGGQYSTLEIVSNGSSWVMTIAPAVSLKYENVAGTTITGTYATIPFATKRWDSHNAFTGGTGTGIAPISGKYLVTSKIYMSGITLGTGQSVSMGVAQQGSFKDVEETPGTGGTLRTYTVKVTSVVNVLKGDSIVVQAKSDASGTITTSSAFNVITMDRIGSYNP